MYGVITADINKSREIEDRAQLQERIHTAIKLVNEQFAEFIAVPFSVTLGDEWQGLLKTIGKSYEIVAAFREALGEISVSFGIGAGEIGTPIYARTSEMDGEAFLRSRSALEIAKKKNRLVVFAAADEKTDLLLNALCALLDNLRDWWTDRQREKIMLYKKYKNETKVAEALGVTQGDINQAIKAGSGRIYLECEEDLNAFLSSF